MKHNNNLQISLIIIHKINGKILNLIKIKSVEYDKIEFINYLIRPR